MSDTYVLQALKTVRAAINAVQAARAAPGLTDEEDSALSAAYVALDDLQDDLIMQDITSEVDAINADAQSLKVVVAQLQTAAGRLKSVADAVGTVAQVVGALAQIVALGATL